MPARVISGKAKGRRLKLVPGDTTRPIMDRVKESLFNILGDIQGTRWLDLYAGTGQVGIEALSRGAAAVVFIDKARAAIQTIRDNLNHTQLMDGA
ncbi:MAG TPA: RsmD family RNA methyltransferase, partial [Promineifilum sp.]|nr:RsmD family RNA methyltransferase [Promineifilum sp.]